MQTMSARVISAPEPAVPCLDCATRAWRCVVDWPEPGEGRWLCGTCLVAAQRPTRLTPPAAATDVATTIAQALAADGWVVVWSIHLATEMLFARSRPSRSQPSTLSCRGSTATSLAVLVRQRPSADRLGAIWTVRDLVANGTLPRAAIPQRDGRHLRRVLIDRHDLDRLIEASKS